MPIRTPVWTVLLAALGMAAEALGAVPPSAEVFGALPRTSLVVLSPDGNTLAWAEALNDQETVKVFDIDARKVVRSQLIEHPMKLRGLNWSDNQTLLLQLSITESAQGGHFSAEFFRVLALDTQSGATRVLLMSGGFRPFVTGSKLLALRGSKPNTVIMSTIDLAVGAGHAQLGTRLADTRRSSAWRLSVYEVNTRSGEGTLIEQGSPFTSDWVVDRDGRVVARSEWNPDGDVFRVLAKNGLGWHEVFHEDGNDHPQQLVGLSPDGSALLTIANVDGTATLMSLPLDGAERRVVFSERGRDVESVIVDRYTLQPVGAIVGGMRLDSHWLEPQEQQRFESVSKAFAGKTLALVSESEDKRRVIALVESPSLPPTFYLVDFKTHKADIVGETYPALATAALGTVKAISYTARDGTTIPAYLTLPPNAEAKNLPLVVMPHGGPEARDYFIFDWWAQFLATRGYAVLQPQFRGSTGFGDAFRRAGRHQWGALMQDDVSDGVRFAIEQGIADARRVCIVGASYGGYAALAGAVFTPQLYSCAVSVNGISNLPEMREWLEKRSGGEQSDTMGYWRDSIGSRIDPQLEAHSPIRGVVEVRAPVLIIYSADDTVVPSGQSENMARALHDDGKEVKLVKLKGDDHWLSHADTRTQMLREIEQFLAAQLH